MAADRYRLSFRGVLSEEELLMLEKAAAAKAEVEVSLDVIAIASWPTHRL